MKGEACCLTILLLTEDSAKEACDTLAAVAKRMLLLVDPHSRTHRIAFEPHSDGARRAMLGNAWKSAEPRDHAKRVELGRAIAAKLLESDPPGFAFIHVDGDRVWAERSTSENRAKLDEFVQGFVEQSVDAALRKQHIETGALEAAKAAAMARFHPVMPFYSIEAWLYQNTAEARRRCATGCCHETIEQWAEDRGELDEIAKPKEALCFGAKHNADLAKGFPADAALIANKSYAAAVTGLREGEALRTALASTYA